MHDVEKIFDFSGYRLMTIRSASLDECINQLKLGHCDGFFISRVHGCDLNSIEFLGDLKEIKALKIMEDVDVKSFDSIKNLTNLEYLNFRVKRLSLNIESLIKLKSLEIEYLDARIKLPDIFPELETLLIGPFNPKSKNLQNLEFARNIQILHIVQSNLDSLAGLDGFYNLKKLVIVQPAAKQPQERSQRMFRLRRAASLCDFFAAWRGRSEWYKKLLCHAWCESSQRLFV